jgi:hypothetical protein
MILRLTRVSVHQTSLTVAIASALLGVVFSVIILPFVLFADAASGGGVRGVTVVLFFPLLYLVFGYLATALWVWIFNNVATRVGGIEFTFAEPPGTENSPLS